MYKVTPDGQKSVFFEPKTKYIWALAIDSNGSLFVATGDSGQVFVVGPDGKGKLFYQSDERHARSLAFDAKGNLLVGTDPNGLILRIEVARKNGAALPDAGASFVVYETSKKEVTALLMDPAGNLYASAIGEKNRPPIPSVPAAILPQPAQPPQITTPQQSGISIAQIQAQTQNQAPFSFFPSTSGGSEVIKIGPDGSPESLWTSREELAFSMALSPAGKILLGTGNKGAIIELDSQNIYSTVAKTASAQVTSLVAGAGGKIFVATANPGKIFTMGPGFESDGSFESDTFRRQDFLALGPAHLVGRQRRHFRQSRLLRSLGKHFQSREELERMVRPLQECLRRNDQLPACAFRSVEGGISRHRPRRYAECFLGEPRVSA